MQCYFEINKYCLGFKSTLILKKKCFFSFENLLIRCEQRFVCIPPQKELIEKFWRKTTSAMKYHSFSCNEPLLNKLYILYRVMASLKICMSTPLLVWDVAVMEDMGCEVPFCFPLPLAFR